MQENSQLRVNEYCGGTLLSKSLIVVPIFNEWPHVMRVLDGLKRVCPNILVIEDGASEKELEDYAKGKGIEYISLPFNMGAWSAIQTGFKYASRRGYDCAVTFDGDGQHLPEEIPKLLECLQWSGCDIVVGSCVDRVGMVRRLCWAILRKLSGIKVNDMTSGFRAYNRRAFEKLSRFSQVNLEYQDIGVLLLANRWGLQTTEVCISMSERISGESKVFPDISSIGKYFLTTLVSVLIKWR